MQFIILVVLATFCLIRLAANCFGKAFGIRRILIAHQRIFVVKLQPADDIWRMAGRGRWREQLSLSIDGEKILIIKSRIAATEEISDSQRAPAVLDGRNLCDRLYVI